MAICTALGLPLASARVRALRVSRDISPGCRGRTRSVMPTPAAATADEVAPAPMLALPSPPPAAAWPACSAACFWAACARPTTSRTAATASVCICATFSCPRCCTTGCDALVATSSRLDTSTRLRAFAPPAVASCMLPLPPLRPEAAMAAAAADVEPRLAMHARVSPAVIPGPPTITGALVSMTSSPGTTEMSGRLASAATRRAPASGMSLGFTDQPGGIMGTSASSNALRLIATSRATSSCAPSSCAERSSPASVEVLPVLSRGVRPVASEASSGGVIGMSLPARSMSWKRRLGRMSWKLACGLLRTRSASSERRRVDAAISVAMAIAELPAACVRSILSSSRISKSKDAMSCAPLLPPLAAVAARVLRRWPCPSAARSYGSGRNTVATSVAPR
mmetsp:Transcript_7496/g.30460  ORF Transcript_7496/g.30460 Transcript_7496/m.30460 type:complete len:395 (-) Transcript_7496:1132-2316(-)